MFVYLFCYHARIVQLLFHHSTCTSFCYIFFLHLVIAIEAILPDKLHVADHKITYMHAELIWRKPQYFSLNENKSFWQTVLQLPDVQFSASTGHILLCIWLFFSLLHCKIPINLSPHPAGISQGPTSSTWAAVTRRAAFPPAAGHGGQTNLLGCCSPATQTSNT